MADISLVFPSSPFLINQQVFPPLGIMYLASNLRRKGWSVECKDLSQTKDKKVDSKLVGISFTTSQRHEAYQLLMYYKALGKTVIAGGPHPTHMPDECFDKGFDYVFRGEADLELPKFMEVWNYSNLTERIITCPDVSEENIIPPDRTVLPLKDYNYEIDGVKSTVIMTTRGCPMNCTFCGKITNKFRMLDADKVIDEIYDLSYTYGFKGFMIFDDVFIASKSRLKRISQAITGEDFAFRCFGRSDMINEEVIDYLAKMNVREVGIGVESGSRSVLKKNMKGTTPEVNGNAVRLLQSKGIRAKAFIIVGLPGETENTIRETKSWIETYKPDDVDFSLLTPMPGSRLFNEPEKWGISFNYNGMPLWYKGTPGKYDTSVRTEEIMPNRLMQIRDELERQYKRQDMLR